MIKLIITDFSRTILFPKDPTNQLELNSIHKNEISKALNKNIFELTSEDLSTNGGVYSADNFFVLNESLLELYSRLKERGLEVIIYTTGFVQTHPDLFGRLEIFKEIVSTEQLGPVRKNEQEAYKLIKERYGLEGNEIVFVDDSKVNREAASAEGINSVEFPKIKAFTNEQQIIEMQNATKQVEAQINVLL